MCTPLAAGLILFPTPAGDGHGGAHDLSYCGCFFSTQCQTVYLVRYLGVELLASWLSHIREFCACVRLLIMAPYRTVPFATPSRQSQPQIGPMVA